MNRLFFNSYNLTPVLRAATFDEDFQWKYSFDITALKSKEWAVLTGLNTSFLNRDVYLSLHYKYNEEDQEFNYRIHVVNKLWNLDTIIPLDKIKSPRLLVTLSRDKFYSEPGHWTIKVNTFSFTVDFHESGRDKIFLINTDYYPHNYNNCILPFKFASFKQEKLT